MLCFGKSWQISCHFFLFLTLDPKMETQCVSFTLPQQFNPKYTNPGNPNGEEDLLRTCKCVCDHLALCLFVHSLNEQLPSLNIRRCFCSFKEFFSQCFLFVQTCGGASFSCPWCRWLWCSSAALLGSAPACAAASPPPWLWEFSTYLQVREMHALHAEKNPERHL